MLSVIVLLLAGGAECNAQQSRVGFGVRQSGKGLTIYIDNYIEGNDYELSMNGGRDYIPLYSSKGKYFPRLTNGTYQICMRKNGDNDTRSDVLAYKYNYLGETLNNNDALDTVVEGVAEQSYGDGKIRITIRDYTPSKNYMYSVDNGITWKKISSRVTEIEDISSGYYNVYVKRVSSRDEAHENIRVYVPSKPLTGHAMIKAPLIKQLPELPTGCEITSLAMAINFYDINIKHTILADYFLEKAEYRAGDYRKKFVGNPREIKAYGCFAGVIENSANKFLDTIKTREFEVLNISGSDPERLYSFLDMGYPVIVWATSKMIPVKEGPRWIDRESGNIITWVGNEHCLLLTGYDIERGYVYMNDPQYGIVSYKMELFEERFNDLEKQGIVIIETTDKKSS